VLRVLALLPAREISLRLVLGMAFPGLLALAEVTLVLMLALVLPTGVVTAWVLLGMMLLLRLTLGEGPSVLVLVLVPVAIVRHESSSRLLSTPRLAPRP
jgi:hypothetical protein